MKDKIKRFKKVYSQELGTCVIYVDTQTGVNYLSVNNGYSGGLTPLLDSEGKIVITPIEKE